MTFRHSRLDVALIHQAVEYQAEVRPENIAIDERGRSITYRELCASMNQIAAVLMQQGIRRNDRVAIYLDNGIDACKAILGALRAGACYVPVNPSMPSTRAASILRDSEPRFVITHQKLLASLSEVAGCLETRPESALLVLDLDKSSAAAAAPAFDTVLGADDISNAQAPGPDLGIEEDLAYIMYTSGTTGKPKGVMITHRNVKSFVQWGVDYFDIQPTDRMSNHSRISFDLSVFDIFGPFFAGATVCPLTESSDLMLPGKFIRDMRLTIWFSVPSVISMLRKGKQLTPGAFSPHLRLGIFCGEALTVDQAKAWLKASPGLRTVNIYGPTEATIACTYQDVTEESLQKSNVNVAIGIPCRDTEIFVLKQDENVKADVDEIGRLMLCGTQLAAGYWRNAQLTQSVFQINPFKADLGARMYDTGDLAFTDAAGIVHWVSRRDNQIKIMGYRVELGEIEAALVSHPDVNEAAVVFQKGDDPILMAAIALAGDANGGDELIDSILDHCARLVPSYMVPRNVHFFPVLPKNTNGKVDRGAIGLKVFAPVV